MRKYKVTVEHELNGELGTSDFLIEAQGVSVTPEWVVFEDGVFGKSSDFLGAFSRDRVIAVVPDE